MAYKEFHRMSMHLAFGRKKLVVVLLIFNLCKRLCWERGTGCILLQMKPSELERIALTWVLLRGDED